jgi:hypothetical protein
MASFTPNRTGEYVGRILYVKEGKRVKSIPVTIMCSMAQLQVTLYTGIVALLTLQDVLAKVFEWDRPLIIFGQAFSIVMIGTAILLTLIYFRIGGSCDEFTNGSP